MVQGGKGRPASAGGFKRPSRCMQCATCLKPQLKKACLRNKALRDGDRGPLDRLSSLDAVSVEVAALEPSQRLSPSPTPEAVSAPSKASAQRCAACVSETCSLALICITVFVPLLSSRSCPRNPGGSPSPSPTLASSTPSKASAQRCCLLWGDLFFIQLHRTACMHGSYPLYTGTTPCRCRCEEYELVHAHPHMLHDKSSACLQTCGLD